MSTGRMWHNITVATSHSLQAVVVDLIISNIPETSDRAIFLDHFLKPFVSLFGLSRDLAPIMPFCKLL
jgi:hypothetical protein